VRKCTQHDTGEQACSLFSVLTRFHPQPQVFAAARRECRFVSDLCGMLLMQRQTGAPYAQGPSNSGSFMRAPTTPLRYCGDALFVVKPSFSVVVALTLT
jgi:hypothetical protein